IQNKLAGFCILQPVLDEANLLLMAIEPRQQGRGLGFDLLDASINLLSNQPVQIFLEVRESNAAAIRLYEKSGFHQIDLRRNYYPRP
ncbi:ribosomal protein S18-alanine N-acetyltransferase, partial [Escherichia coli]|uniref:ribosomal protein S18-alanine N-acetyltransferase n=1 Tax=Escherichia coli TaxID=562 RepID=UPI001ED9F248